jgi:hypothetical protein
MNQHHVKTTPNAKRAKDAKKSGVFSDFAGFAVFAFQGPFDPVSAGTVH